MTHKIWNLNSFIFLSLLIPSVTITAHSNLPHTAHFNIAEATGSGSPSEQMTILNGLFK